MTMLKVCYDGLSLSQQIPLSEHVYKRLNELGIKQIAQHYMLDLIHMIWS